MDKNIRKLAIFYVVLIIILVFNLSWMQVIDRERIVENPANPRHLVEDYGIKRGRIFTSDRVLIAESREREGTIKYLRYYPEGSLYSQVLGYDSPQLGRSGIEEQYNDYLLAKDRVQGFLERLLRTRKEGYDIHLTIESEVQRAAAAALGNRRGAVIAINPRNGAVLAMVSYPTFDPNLLVSQEKEGERPSGEIAMERYTQEASSPLLNRATMGLYPPGSSFKILTTAAALDGAGLSPSIVFNCPGTWEVGGFRVTNYGHTNYGNIDMTDALAKSVNTYFAQLATKIGSELLVRYAEEGGMNQRIPLDYPAVAVSTIPSASEMDLAELAWTGVGQGRLQLSPLQLCIFGCAIANGGVIMTPHLLEDVRDRENIITKFETKAWKRLMSPATATTELTMMQEVVKSGTGRAAAIEGYAVAGKTGTAEAGEGKPNHTWFVGIAPAQNPQVVVAVVVENSGGTGGATAAPIARQVLLAALR